MLKLPTEILSKIFQEAAWVPEVLDTSPSIFFRDHEAEVQLIHESMKTKTALSLVSKAFHSVMEIHLYDIVMIHRFQYVPVLLRLLRTTPPGFQSPRGHRCRRLDIYLGVGGINYYGEAWFEGGHTLWGLVTSCTRLEVLVARVHSTAPGTTKQWPHLTHNALWKTIATCCSKTLRRLDLHGFYIRWDRLEMILRYLTKLEVCHIVHASPFDPYEGSYDDEESRDRYYHFERGNPHRSVALRDDSMNVGLSGWFDAATVADFNAAKRDSRWPTFIGSAPYTLPSLHTLHLDAMDPKRINQFRSPSLRHLSMILPSGSGHYEPLQRNCGLFPASLTHLVYCGRHIAVDALITLFPHLKFVCIAIDLREPFPPSYFAMPHQNLEVVELISWHKPANLCQFVQELLGAVRETKLPRLCAIKVIQFKKYDKGRKGLPFDESEALGVRLEVIQKRKHLTLCGDNRRHN
ncbi:hypothetical protein DXG01_009999 [Tephrocybe rancida]|nr:hypothetical protein DXG01_009999 [Tephrocybe rancida]